LQHICEELSYGDLCKREGSLEVRGDADEEDKGCSSPMSKEDPDAAWWHTDDGTPLSEPDIHYQDRRHER
jgi:hypothetical protein